MNRLDLPDPYPPSHFPSLDVKERLCCHDDKHNVCDVLVGVYCLLLSKLYRLYVLGGGVILVVVLLYGVLGGNRTNPVIARRVLL